MINERHELNEWEEITFELFKQGQRSGSPRSRVNPLYLHEHSDLEKDQVEYVFRNLTDVGWIT